MTRLGHSRGSVLVSCAGGAGARLDHSTSGGCLVPRRPFTYAKRQSPMKTSFIGTALTSTGRCVAIGTDKTKSIVADAETWETLVTWRGAEVTACGTIGDKIVCAALDGVVFLVDERRVDRIAHGDKTAWFYAVAPIGPTTGLLGGSTGRLFQSRSRDGNSARAGTASINR
jgi:hypothetical protein